MSVMKKYLNSKAVIYVCFLVMLLVVLFSGQVSFEPGEIGRTRQILFPENPIGKLSYDPHHHYNYIVASVAERLGYKGNVADLAGLFWFLEMGLAIMVLTRLSNFVFKNDKTILVILVMLFILAPSGQIDQKTMVVPLYLLAIYYFLREKWIISALFGAAIFYLHVGMAIWWFLPSCFALGILFFIHKRVSLKSLASYPIAVMAGALPIIYFYLWRLKDSGVNAYYIKYYYHKYWFASSVLLTLKNEPLVLLSTLLMVAVLLVGYLKARRSGYKIDNIMPIAAGVLILYFVNLIFADILGSGTVITLQLLRSIRFVEFFSLLFFAFLLAKQIKQGNYVFFLIFALLSLVPFVMKRFVPGLNIRSSLMVFYAAFLAYEIFEGRILHFAEVALKTIERRFDLARLKAIAAKGHELLRSPVVIAVFLILLMVPRLPATYLAIASVKSMLNRPQQEVLVSLTPDQYLTVDMVRFTNENIKDKDALLLIPFLKIDFTYFSDHQVFITYLTPFSDVLYRNKRYKFEQILKDDLDYPLEKLFEDYSDENFNNKWKMLWRDLDEVTIRRWKNKYGLTHVIREKELPLDFSVLYQNPYYVIYEIR